MNFFSPPGRIILNDPGITEVNQTLSEHLCLFSGTGFVFIIPFSKRQEPSSQDKRLSQQILLQEPASSLVVCCRFLLTFPVQQYAHHLPQFQSVFQAP